MRGLVFALVLVLLVASVSAPDCYYCQTKKPTDECVIITRTCPAELDACTAVKFTNVPYAHYQRCTSMANCQLQKLNAYLKVTCCQEDLCNIL